MFNLQGVRALGRQSLAGLRTLLLFTVVLGIAYPLVVWGIGQAAFGWRADGSLVTTTGAHTRSFADAAGSSLIGQDFKGNKWFLPRPSAAGTGYDPLDTYGSNYGPEDPRLVKLIKQRQAEISAREHVAVSAIPPDAVTASASGLDPAISPAYAALQAARVAREHGLTLTSVQRLIKENTTGRALGFLGDPAVNVLMLNIAITQAHGS
ncbi:MAG: K+-transporting ATPase, subunit [Marmoricola sp.]|nr:K+-transporting ATPase, subunit [Marmoricola sp.]